MKLFIDSGKIIPIKTMRSYYHLQHDTKPRCTLHTNHTQQPNKYLT